MKHLSCPLAGLVFAAGALLLLTPGTSSQPPEPGIKLCGRDFVRTVIISCGGSRWKRYSPEENDGRRSFYSALLDSLDDSPLSSSIEDPEAGETEDAEPETPTGGETPLPRFEGHAASVGSSEDWDEEHRARLSSAFLVPLQESSLRSKRSTGVAKACCKRGCTRSEITKLC
ncbi:relaxin-3-like [Heptranchias perlo]|uniref:relaxin-3-like n=1 Tax=Heptranchias perlo TaxID=212740 RepID=UPI0035595E26